MIGSDKDHRKRVDRFVCCENVARFRKMLSTALDEDERKALMHLLMVEESRRRHLGEGAPVMDGAGAQYP